MVTVARRVKPKPSAAQLKNIKRLETYSPKTARRRKLVEIVDTLPPVAAIKAELASRSFRKFVEYVAWPALWPRTKFKGNWHIDAICEHLEAVKSGEIRKLLINMPFRMLKSTLVSHAFPAWDWINTPSRQFLTASYSMNVATRDAVDSRRIIDSPLYQAFYGDRFKLVGDQNVKSRYENDKRGTRTVTATESAGTGFGGDIRIVDDPVSAKQADSHAAIQASIEWWKGTMATRANDPATGAVIIVHQRLSANDLTGYVLAEESGWDHLVLPFRYDSKLSKTTSIGFKDPRTVEGELIHPERIPEDTAKDLEKTLGSYHVEAQLQQNPSPRGGVIFSRDKWNYWKVLPSGIEDVILSVDCSFKGLSSSDSVAIQGWGIKNADKYLLKRVVGKMNFAATCDAVVQTAALFPKRIAVLVEDKANGPAVIETLRTRISGMIPINPEGGKASRAFAMQPEQEAGNIYIPDVSVDPEIGLFVEQTAKFTGADGQADDEVDAMTQAINWYRTRKGVGEGQGVFDYYKQLYEQQQREAMR